MSATVEGLQKQFDAVLGQYFQVIPVNTKRQDQQYKRRYHAWQQCSPPGSKLLILAPQCSQADWLPSIEQLATEFADSVERTALARLASVGASPIIVSSSSSSSTKLSSDAKVFPDSVFDEPALTSPLWHAVMDPRPLTPAMQRSAFWTPSADKLSPEECHQQTNAVKALLLAARDDTVLRIARDPASWVKEVARFETRGNRVRRCSQGWQSVAEDALEVMFFHWILKTFPASLLGSGTAYENWMPFAFQNLWSVTRRYTAAACPAQDDRPRLEDQWLPTSTLCFSTLCEAEMLTRACGLPSMVTRRWIVSSLLNFIGFEAWNREAEAQMFYSRSLQQEKWDKKEPKKICAWWLWKGSLIGEEDEGLPTTTPTPTTTTTTLSRAESRPSRPIDPLLLREPYKEQKEDAEEEDEDEESRRLAALESEEALYGRNRSAKYRQKGGDV